MSNTTLTPDGLGGQLICPLLQIMRNHSLNNNTSGNMVMVSILGLVSCLGILENALILWVVGFRLRRRTVASVWVLNLAMSDFLATLTLPLFTLYLNSAHSWELGSPQNTGLHLFFEHVYVSLLAGSHLTGPLPPGCPASVEPESSVSGRSMESVRIGLALGSTQYITLLPFSLSDCENGWEEALLS